MEPPECCRPKTYYDETRKFHFRTEFIAAKIRGVDDCGDGIVEYSYFHREVCRMVLNELLSEEERQTVLAFLREKENVIQNMYLCMCAEEISRKKCCPEKGSEPDLSIFESNFLEKTITETAAGLADLFVKTQNA